MDVHKDSFTLCGMEPKFGGKDTVFSTIKTGPHADLVIDYIDHLREKLQDEDLDIECGYEAGCLGYVLYAELKARKTGPHADLVIDYIDHLREKLQDEDLDIECGYEAGCLGYVLYAELKARGVKCTILAPTTMMAPQGKRVKTYARDALMIAQCLSYGGYKAVHIPTGHDAAVSGFLRLSDDQKAALKKIKQQILSFALRNGLRCEANNWTQVHLQFLRYQKCDPTGQDAAVSGFLRMRDDHKAALKKIKQQILSFALRNGLRCEANNWTQVHLQFLRYQKCDPVVRETLNEYLQTYDYLNNRIDAMNKRIHEFCQEKAYCENVKKLQCLIGIKEHTLSEQSDRCDE